MPDWHRNAVIYSLDVHQFKDSNGDGQGDFPGLTSALDYLDGLGVQCLWLLPIFDTPNRDNGYDVRDYYRLDPSLGTPGEFATLLEQAQERGIRVLVDLPFNHTSVEHAWFQQARSDRTSPYHDYYVWADQPPEHGEEKLIFGDEQGGNWCYEAGVDRWYYHTFYDHQPDLNFANPAVRDEMRDVMRFWLRQGVAGFRMDAVPHMIEDKGGVGFAGDGHACLKELRAFVQAHWPQAVLLAEADEEPDEVARFFGDGDEFHLLLNFYLCNYLWLAFARGDGAPLRHALAKLPDMHGKGQWAHFLRNHDELDLERLKPDEFDDTMRAFAPDEDMKVFGRGIRRRVAPMLGDDPRRLQLAYSLLLTLPGTPVLRYGQEIGMGEDLSLEARDAVRTPMQWSPEPNGGFSSAPREALVAPPIEQGPYGYCARNVTDQRRDPDALLNWMERALRVRRDCPEFGLGAFDGVGVSDSRAFAHRCRVDHRFTLAVHNLSEQTIEVELDLDAEDCAHLLDLFGDRKYGNWDHSTPRLTLGPYGYRWFRRTRFRHDQ